MLFVKASQPVYQPVKLTAVPALLQVISPEQIQVILPIILLQFNPSFENLRAAH